MTHVKKTNLCSQAEQYYYDYLTADDENTIPQDIAGHIVSCRYCLEQIEDLKSTLSDDISPAQFKHDRAVTKMLKLHFNYLDKAVRCGEVKPFLPVLAGMAKPMRIPTPITAHLEHCSKCRKDLQTINGLQLNASGLIRLSELLTQSAKTRQIDSPWLETARSLAGDRIDKIIRIAQRPNSGIETVSSIEKLDRRIESEAVRSCEGLPIRVCVRGQRENVLPRYLKMFGKIAAVAAVIIIAAMFLNQSQTAKAVLLAQIYDAVDKAPVVHLTRYSGNDDTINFETWIDKTNQICIIKYEDKITVWDAANRTKKSIDLISRQLTDEAIDPAMVEATKWRVRHSTGVMPFDDVSMVPENARWITLESGQDRIEVYDLVWHIQTGPNFYVYKKHRFFVDVATKLPVRTEYYQKTSFEQDEDYRFVSYSILEYTDSSGIEGVIDRYFNGLATPGTN